MTNAEQKLKELGYQLFKKYDNECIREYIYSQGTDKIIFTEYSSKNDWCVEVLSYDPDYDMYSTPAAVDIVLARAIIQRLEELNGE